MITIKENGVTYGNELFWKIDNFWIDFEMITYFCGKTWMCVI